MIRRATPLAFLLAVPILAAPLLQAQSKAAPKPRAAAAPAPAAAPASGSVAVRASVDRTAIWPGDRVTYAIDLICARGVEILLDDLAKEKLRVNGLDIISSDTTTTVDAEERTTYRLRYVLATYRVDAASLSIEPLSARYYQRRPGQRLQDIAPAGEVMIPGAVIAFRSTLPDLPVYELRDDRAAAPRHPVAARAGSIGLALVVISLVPAALVVMTLVRRRTPRSGRRSARQVRIDHRTTLERLRSLEVTSEEDRRRAYDEISAAVRQHLASTSGVPATSLTSSEVNAALETGVGARRNGGNRESVTALLAACDEARYGPPDALPPPQACRDAIAAAAQMLSAR